MDSPTTYRMSRPKFFLLLTALWGGPIGTVVAIIAYSRVPPATHETSMILANAVRLHDPVLSPTHWNRVVVSEATADAGTYAENFRIAHDPQEEDEDQRIYRQYPLASEIKKAHFASLEAAKLATGVEFFTRMVRTTSSHGPAHDPWRYERLDSTGAVQFSGFADDPVVKVQCASCHENAQRRDFIFTTHLGNL